MRITVLKTWTLLLYLLTVPAFSQAQESGQRSGDKVSFGTIMLITVCVVIAANVINNMFRNQSKRTNAPQNKPETPNQNAGVAEKDQQSGITNGREDGGKCP
jgi:flagellar basal body-associated protein FliL